jgi:hypothetical protein
MTTMTHNVQPSRVELELALHAALLHTPREIGRGRARRTTGRLTAGLAATAGVVAVCDVLLLLLLSG